MAHRLLDRVPIGAPFHVEGSVPVSQFAGRTQMPRLYRVSFTTSCAWAPTVTVWPQSLPSRRAINHLPPVLPCIEGRTQCSTFKPVPIPCNSPLGQLSGKDKVEQLPGIRHLLAVRTIRITMVSLVALMWVLLTSHCKIEAMPGFEFLRCAADIHAPAESESGGDPCKDTGCCSIESAQYHAPRQHELVPIVLLAIVPADNFSVVEQSLPKEVSLGILTAAPPELPTSWQFLSRTALPVRAPSLAS